jgi:uncharacterized membrane protein YraQ (UPF0718 family)
MCPTAAAAAAGSLLAVCSCSIVPLFAGIYKKGAGLGPAVTFLFFAPAGIVLALAYTGIILGVEFAFARVVLCLLFGIGIGLPAALRAWLLERRARPTPARPSLTRSVDMKTVRILGSGCANCRKLEAMAREAAGSAG